MEKVEHGGKSHRDHEGEERPEWGLGKLTVVCAGKDP